MELSWKKAPFSWGDSLGKENSHISVICVMQMVSAQEAEYRDWGNVIPTSPWLSQWAGWWKGDINTRFSCLLGATFTNISKFITPTLCPIHDANQVFLKTHFSFYSSARYLISAVVSGSCLKAGIQAGIHKFFTFCISMISALAGV